ncbi:FAD dependent oxidoreductase [Solidesulfovibrio carbinoliphilus subsp. oakridgensis]|uniref:FAD dependent oxidoreductase n=1 Tax=Solidesulfovibrio carbinoliphilus subsp. oakridgensis TaxID=694327 RepID=G7QCY7_9BACT|nr:L-2-hydroxyglutarate oxidase [Solidesulfovibrio carbinoliphilus]EHJ46293.1 FAD dependent oxidoreductase [Solidesulfovibrio carbinoliphilus subsp. oakridgensis]
MRAHTVIVGAGILGLTLARELLARGGDGIVLLDKEAGPGRHASGRNSGVLHAGIYYAPDTLRAKTCLAGNRLMQAYCLERGLPLSRCGKVIVARSEAELPGLIALRDRALANGATVRLVDERELAEIEPQARTAGQALFSPETAVVDPKAILAALARDVEMSGRARILWNTRAVGPKRPGVLATQAGDIEYQRLANVAGAYADKLAHAFSLGRNYRLVPFKGVYRKLRPQAARLVRGNIYPVPDPRNPFLGIHFTRSLSGEVSIGPTSIPAFGRENYGLLSGLDLEAASILLRDALLFAVNPGFRSVALSEPRKYLSAPFFADASRLLRDLKPEDVVPSDKVGIRPQLVDVKASRLVSDFVPEEGPRELHVLGAISPAFTASMAFAPWLADRLAGLAG